MDGPAESSHWVQSFTRPASQPSQDGGEPRFAPHPNFPRVPASVPLTYTLTMVACLSERPEDRPTFTHVLTVLLDVVAEVAQGTYINSDGAILVGIPHMRLHQSCVLCLWPSINAKNTVGSENH